MPFGGHNLQSSACLHAQAFASWLKSCRPCSAGNKAFISGGGAADVYLIMARTGQQPGARGISAFLVDKVRGWHNHDLRSIPAL